MNNYDFYYPNRFRAKTKNFSNIFNEIKAVENAWGSAVKQDKIIEKHFGKALSNEVKNSKLFSFLEYMRFEGAGSNIFHFKKELLELLEKTDVSNLPIGAVKFPYNRFYLSIRELGKPLNSTSDAIIDGVYVQFNDESKDEGLYDYWATFSVCGYDTNAIDEFKLNTKDLMEFASGLNFENDASTITDALKVAQQIMKDTQQDPKRDKATLDREVDFQRKEYKLLTDNLNLFINCILYISSDRPDIKTKYAEGLPFHLKGKLDKANTKRRLELAEKEASAFGYSKIKLVGCTYSRSFDSPSNNLVVAPHWRRGHWRNQPFGKQLSDTKIIWIKPTIVNKEIGEPVKGHIYTTE